MPDHLVTTGDLLELAVSDDGIGPPPADTASRGVGLDSMRERATELGGSFSIEARPAGGTMVRALFPVGARIPVTGDAQVPSEMFTETSTGNT